MMAEGYLRSADEWSELGIESLVIIVKSFQIPTNNFAFLNTFFELEQVQG